MVPLERGVHLVSKTFEFTPNGFLDHLQFNFKTQHLIYFQKKKKKIYSKFLGRAGTLFGPAQLRTVAGGARAGFQKILTGGSRESVTH